jgi:hypothetical protein
MIDFTIDHRGARASFLAAGADDAGCVNLDYELGQVNNKPPIFLQLV